MIKKPTIGQQLDEKLETLATKQDIADLKDDVGNLKDDVGNLKDDVGNLKDDVGNLKDDVGSLKDDMRSLIGAFNENTRSIQSALASKGMPVKLTTAKVKRTGKAGG